MSIIAGTIINLTEYNCIQCYPEYNGLTLTEYTYIRILNEYTCFLYSAALTLTALMGDVDGATQLLDASADIEARTADGSTALIIAAQTDQSGRAPLT